MLSENAETSANALRREVLRFKDFLSHAQEIQTVYANFFLFTAPPTRRQNAYARGGLFKKKTLLTFTYAKPVPAYAKRRF